MENNQEIIESAELNMMAAISHLETEIAKIGPGAVQPDRRCSGDTGDYRRHVARTGAHNHDDQHPRCPHRAGPAHAL